MKLVIEIDEVRYKDIQRIAEVQLERNHFQTAEQIIASGTPLPKGYGRLIDADLLSTIFTDQYPKNYMNEPELSGTVAHFSLRYILQVLNSESCVPTIIEADKAESEDEE